MRAVDTNVVVRLLTADDKRQAKAARMLFEQGDIFISRTVMLESEWVLRSGYGFSADRIARVLCGLAGLPGVTVEDPVLIATALDWMGEGMDFADALHLLKSDGCTAFMSFDRKLARRAEGRSVTPVESP